MRHIIILFFLCVSIHGRAQIVAPNNGFEIADNKNDTRTEGWVLEGAPGTCSVDKAEHYTGKYAMKVSRKEATGKDFFNREIPFSTKGLKKYTISCAMKAKGLKGTAGLGARVFDKDGNSITGYRAFVISQDQDWTMMEGEFYSDEAAVKLRIFGNVEGEGTAWFDEISIREVPMPKGELSAEAAKYLEEYFDYVFKYSVVRDTPHLNKLKQNTAQLLAGSNNKAYFQNVLKRYTTLKLNDGHSFFWTDEDWKGYKKGSNDMSNKGLINFPEGKMITGQVAYIKIGTFATLDTSIIQRYVDSVQTIIRKLDEQDPKGWVLDISGNSGGNSFAMLAGLGPLLGNGVCGYSQSADGSKRTRMCNNGWVGWFPEMEHVQKTPVYKLVHKDLPIAVIYGNATGSSGEVVAISFRGKSNTRSFGTPTSGTTTRVDNLEMSDGAVLNLAAGWDADRTGHVYKGPVPPNVTTENSEAAIAEAAKWIANKN